MRDDFVCLHFVEICPNFLERPEACFDTASNVFAAKPLEEDVGDVRPQGSQRRRLIELHASIFRLVAVLASPVGLLHQRRVLVPHRRHNLQLRWQDKGVAQRARQHSGLLGGVEAQAQHQREQCSHSGVCGVDALVGRLGLRSPLSSALVPRFPGPLSFAIFLFELVRRGCW